MVIAETVDRDAAFKTMGDALRHFDPFLRRGSTPLRFVLKQLRESR